MQMAVRGMRPYPGKIDCMVLDFAGVVQTHGPITNVQPPKKGSSGDGEAPIKICETCGELCAISMQVCPACGAAFPEPVAKSMSLRHDDIMGLEGMDLDVTHWRWRKHLSRASGKEMLACTYYGGLSDPPITEYLAVAHDGYAGDKSMRLLSTMASSAKVPMQLTSNEMLTDIADLMNLGTPPSSIEYKKDGKFFRILKRTWE